MKFRKKELIDLIIVFIISLIFSLVLLQTDLGYRKILPLIIFCITLIMIIKSYNSYILLDNEGISGIIFKLFKGEQTIFRYKYDEIKDIKIGKNGSYWTYLSIERSSKINPSSQNIKLSLESGEDIRIGKIFHMKKFMHLLNENKTNYAKQSYSKIDSHSIYSIKKSLKEYYKEKKVGPGDELFQLNSDSSLKKIIINSFIFSLPIVIIYEYLDYQFDFILKDSLFYNEHPIVKILLVYSIIFTIHSIPDLLTLKNFIKLTGDCIVIIQNREILKFKYSDIEQIEVVIVEKNNTCIYIKLKNQKLKEVFYGIKDGHAFMNAIKKKGINADFVSSDETISDLKEEDWY